MSFDFLAPTARILWAFVWINAWKRVNAISRTSSNSQRTVTVWAKDNFPRQNCINNFCVTLHGFPTHSLFFAQNVDNGFLFRYAFVKNSIGKFTLFLNQFLKASVTILLQFDLATISCASQCGKAMKKKTRCSNELWQIVLQAEQFVLFFCGIERKEKSEWSEKVLFAPVGPKFHFVFNFFILSQNSQHFRKKLFTRLNVKLTYRHNDKP